MVASMDIKISAPHRRRRSVSLPWVVGLVFGLGLNLGALALLGIRGFDGVFPHGGRIQTPVIYADLEPWPVIRRTPHLVGLEGGAEVSANSIPQVRQLPAGSAPDAVSLSPNESGGVSDAPAPVANPWQVAPTSRDRIAQSLRRGAIGCADRARLAPVDREWCDQRAQVAGPAIFGSGDSTRDARFARQGARRLAEVEAREGAPSLLRKGCDRNGPIAECGAEVKVELYSSIRGFLPNLRNRDDD
jgi:hypothetical protein